VEAQSVSAKTGIQWTDATWNPVVGCTKVSQGCKHCYAKTIHDLRHKAFLAGKKVAAQYAHPFETVQLKPERLTAPLSWRKPRRIFVNSVSDLFHDDVPFEFIAQVFAVMSLAERHTFQILTKRPERMLAFFAWVASEGERLKDLPTHDAWDGTNVVTHHACQVNLGDAFDRALSAVADDFPPAWPLENVWLGVSVENQAAADERIPLLVKTPAAVRFLSCEPLLGPVDLKGSLRKLMWRTGESPLWIDWVIIGGESGKDARTFYLEWAESLIDQCRAASVPPFVKQIGARAFTGGVIPQPYSIGGHGDDMERWPNNLRVREFPVVRSA
jgi:protein gp37